MPMSRRLLINEYFVKDSFKIDSFTLVYTYFIPYYICFTICHRLDPPPRYIPRNRNLCKDTTNL